MPGRDDLPSTLRRSPKGAQDTWVRTHDSALQTYGRGRRASQAAYASLKHSYEKVGDHWERKPDSGPSDRQARRGGPASRRRPSPTAGGVNATASRDHLYRIAQRLDIPGRSSMTKQRLVEAIQRANQRRTAKARKR